MFLSLEIACSVNAVRGGCGTSAGQVGVGGWGGLRLHLVLATSFLLVFLQMQLSQI